MNNALSIPEEDFEAAEKAKLIAEHNDRFRNTWGADFTIPGQIVMTQAVAALSPAWITRAMAAIQRFDDFTEDNDPYGDHCFGAVEITVGDETKTIWFKIDLYDWNLEYGAEDPTDLEKTKRVMTVLFPSDY
ncbi:MULTISPECIES: DUF3768 domain-containing protein [Halocynthiibacter]|uniref:DUF3768 domain-containing protein n=1 Tax=Halocynthiibacter halioticoli TaxID=2986804 RepID=A0AAE3LSY0_9RHOB|nr:MULTISPECIES: DUF3768 domain-containing protein [Halocynthiibacter]MCV6826079.1 DUF3768 domain-containing protein [Halocynthiibacter halioticoli]MCW4059080.1 DUF3768 domain-containing protein [Halocynthiibacter sp. SDUM655004]